MRTIFVKLLLVTLSIIFLISCGKDKDVIATVGDLSITEAELIAQLKTRYPNEKDYKSIDAQKKKDILDQIINKKLKVQAALDLGIEKDEEIVKAIQKQEENLLSQKYFEAVVVDKLISKKDIDDYVERQGVELKVTFILIGHEKAHIAKKRSKEEAQILAEKIAKEAKSGNDFNDLAIKYSEDPGVKNNKGDLGYFKWGQKPKPFQQACWDMKVGEISDPVQTVYGFNIIRLDDRKKVENFEPDHSPEKIFRIKQTLYSTVADSGKKLWEETYKNLQEAKSYQLENDAINEAAKMMTEKVKTVKVDINSFTEEESNVVFAKWDDNKVTLKTILNRYENNLPRVVGALGKSKNLQNEVRNLSMITIALSEAKRMNLHELEDVAKVLNNFREDRLVQLVEKKEIQEKVSATDEEVKNFYNENPDQYMKPAQMEMWDILVETEKEADRVAALARKGRNFESLAKKYSTDKYYKEKGGYLGFRAVNARSTVSRGAFDIGPNGKISDPIKFKKKWAIVKTGELKEKELRSFQEVKRMAEGRVKSNKMAELRKEWKNKLDEQYPTKIDEEKLANL